MPSWTELNWRRFDFGLDFPQSTHLLFLAPVAKLSVHCMRYSKQTGHRHTTHDHRNTLFTAAWRTGTAQQLERWTCDCKVMVSSPGRSGGKTVCSRVKFLCWLLFQHLFYLQCYGTRLFHRLKIKRFSGSLAELFLAPPHSCAVSEI